MMDAVKSWWSGLSRRERWLVGIAGILALAVFGWAIGRPAVAAFVDLETRHQAAIEREGRVAAKAALLGQKPAKSVAATTDAIRLTRAERLVVGGGMPRPAAEVIHQVGDDVRRPRLLREREVLRREHVTVETETELHGGKRTG